MFKGKCFSLTQVNRDRFEFRSAYTHRIGNFAEIQKIVSVQAIAQAEERRELLAIQEQLKQAEQTAVLRQLAPPPANTNAAPPPAVRLVPSLPKEREVARTAPKAKKAPQNHVNVVEMKDAKKRRSSGLNYLRSLDGSPALEKAR
jgi:hypothetical protein